MSPTRVAKLQKKAQYCHTCCSNLRGDCTGADQVERQGLGRRLTKWSGGDRCHSGGFLLRIMPPSWQPVPACVRHGHSAGGPFFRAAAMVLQAEPITSTPLQRFPNSHPEIKNHCAREAVSWQKPAVIAKFTPSNQESLHARGPFQAKPCSDSQINPLKSRITAVSRSFSVQSLQRFPN